MQTPPLLRSPFIQVCYHVPDVELAARQMAATFGWGPFLVVHHVAVEACLYRGKPGIFDISSACGQAGPIQVELIQQHGDDPSIIRDMFAKNQTGVHHHACIAATVDAELKYYHDLGYPTIMRAKTAMGVDFAFVDTRPLLGYLVEVYPDGPFLREWYKLVRDAAQGWGGDDPVRVLNEENLKEMV